jgi:hypothetical protein
MLSFLSKFATVVRGVLSGFDRLFLRGTLRGVSYCKGLQAYLWANRIPFKDFARHSLDVSARLEQASLQQAQQLGREVRYLNSAQHRKEDIAREIAARDKIKSGLICVLRSVDPCMSFQINKNYQTKKLEIKYRQRKCLHLYHYQIHPVFGFMHARIQTWFPFQVSVCLNGREWLARQMDQAQLHYKRRDNTFTWLQDLEQTQKLFDQQLQANWPSLLRGLAADLNPAHADIFAHCPCRYYWSVADSEWASDVMFRSRAQLEEVYQPLVRYAVNTFDAVDVLRFLGQPVPASGKVPHHWRHEVVTNLKERVEGIRLKHWVNQNSVKMYDKGSVLRVETTLRQPGDFKVYRPAEGEPEGAPDWRPLRKGIADLHRRGEVSQACNGRYLEALAAVHDRTPLSELAEPLCRPALEPSRRRGSVATAAVAEVVPGAAPSPVSVGEPGTPVSVGEPGSPGATAAFGAASLPAGETGAAATEAAAAAVTPVVRASRPRRVRALNPLSGSDAALLKAVSRHEFLVNGLRNRSLREALYGKEPVAATEERRRSAAVTRQLRLLRAHGLIQKVPKTHRYMVTSRGRKALTALLAVWNASVEELTRCAA